MMPLCAPRFWYDANGGIPARILAPLGWLWCMAAARRQRHANTYAARIPVICLGNVTIGGAGKTPTAIALMQALMEGGKVRNPCFLTRGYGGEARTATLAAMPESTRHGDESVLLARHAPVVVAADRVAGLKLTESAGFDLVIADDGYQNPSFAKTAGVLVFDGAVGIGNGRCIPAGPLRESLAAALERAHAAVIIGPDKTGLRARLGDLPVFMGRIEAGALPQARYLAFAGIGRPDKFFDTLRGGLAELAACIPFPDHHPYSESDMQRLERLAAQHGAQLVTTEKDHVRIPLAWRDRVSTLKVRVVIDAMADLVRLLVP
ncbi:MAG: tetraacyldisaccharide 4'-kinase [Rhodospirillales bacterium]|nr:tetraacyldisaccharide 4'-kinase [Alphaproteobacteria bacterium]MCB9986009.1 tetraacyldisaccharide 4'-kinase [Rhodospirillales bacterium]USO07416.1 MAG: tetraacyldisaccharide 4'-kinase [Rhodospirillales bacterium]